MSLKNDVIRSLKWLAGLRFAGQLVTWAITLIVIRILKPSDYGLMAIADILIGFAALFQELGLYSAMVQKRDLTDRQIEQAFGFLLLLNSFIYALVFIGAPLLGDFFGDSRLTDIARVLGLQFPLAAVGVVQDAMLSRRMQFKEKSFANLAIMLVNGAATLSLALAGAGVWALVFGALAGSIVRPIALSLAARHWCRPRFSSHGMRDMFQFGGFTTATGLLWYTYSQTDVFIIGKVLGKQALGFYAIAMQLASLPLQKVGETLNQVGLAAYSSVQYDREAIRSHYLRAIRALAFVAFPIFWGISSVSPTLVPVLLGQRWAPAVVPLQLLSLIMPLRMVAHSGEPLSAIGKPHIETINHFITLIVLAPAFLIGALAGGLTGVALAWVVTFPLVILVRLHLSLPLLGLTLRHYLAALAGPAAGGLIMYAAVAFTRNTLQHAGIDVRFALLLMIAVGALAYSAFMWFFRRSDCREMISLAKRSE